MGSKKTSDTKLQKKAGVLRAAHYSFVSIFYFTSSKGGLIALNLLTIALRGYQNLLKVKFFKKIRNLNLLDYKTDFFLQKIYNYVHMKPLLGFFMKQIEYFLR